ncbi:sporulation protein SsgA, partial [Streptomyces albidoflavus]
MNTVVYSELELRLVLPPARSIVVPARLVYAADDPFEVSVLLHL